MTMTLINKCFVEAFDRVFGNRNKIDLDKLNTKALSEEAKAKELEAYLTVKTRIHNAKVRQNKANIALKKLRS